MSVAVKICGLSDAAGVGAAVSHGAAFVGFVFHKRSPRFVTPEAAAILGQGVPAAVGKVGLLVDDDDECIADILARCPLDCLQLHGTESPARVAAIRSRFGLPVIKALAIAGAADLDRAADYESAVDRLLFDARPPAGALPGGNALSFDWSLLRGRHFARPWLLAGGLHAGNLAAAMLASDARMLDVSSGVEDSPGKKSPAKIAQFLRLAHGLRPHDPHPQGLRPQGLHL